LAPLIRVRAPAIAVGSGQCELCPIGARLAYSLIARVWRCIVWPWPVTRRITRGSEIGASATDVGSM